MVSVDRATEVTSHKEYIANLRGATGEHPVGEALDGQRRAEGAWCGAADVSTDEFKPSLSGGTASTIGEVLEPFYFDVRPHQNREQGVTRRRARCGEVAEVTLDKLGTGLLARTGEVEVATEDDGVDGGDAEGSFLCSREDGAIAPRSGGKGWASVGQGSDKTVDDFALGQFTDTEFALLREDAHDATLMEVFRSVRNPPLKETPSRRLELHGCVRRDVQPDKGN